MVGSGSKTSLGVWVTGDLLCIRTVMSAAMANHCSIEQGMPLFPHDQALLSSGCNLLDGSPLMETSASCSLCFPLGHRGKAHRQSCGSGAEVQDLQI